MSAAIHLLFRPVLALALGVGLAGGHAATAQEAARTELRVCADPSNLPFSNQAEEGFENRIAALFGDRLGLPVVYTWWPATIGFFRNTLRAYECDLVMGVTEGFELAATTAPYYRSTYVIVTRSDSGLDLQSLADPALHELWIGIVANTPPVDLLVRHGLLDRVRPYQLMVDTRAETPARDMIHDVANGTLDLAIAWGPIAGYYAKQQVPPLVVAPVADEPGAPPMSFAISAAVRHREPEWKQQVESFLADNRVRIEAILRDYGVPLVADPDASLE